MASINSVVKRKQFIWLGIVLATVGVVGGGGWYLADARYEGSSDAAAAGEPAPDMTGVWWTAPLTRRCSIMPRPRCRLRPPRCRSSMPKCAASLSCSARGRQAISTRLTNSVRIMRRFPLRSARWGRNPSPHRVSRPRSRQCLRRGLKVSRSRPVSRRRRGPSRRRPRSILVTASRRRRRCSTSPSPYPTSCAGSLLPTATRVKVRPCRTSRRAASPNRC